VLLSKLGEGGFGQVWKARDDNGFEVALKFVRIDLRTGAAEVRALGVMKNIRHPHVLPMNRLWHLGSWLALALELGDKTLYQRLAEAEKDGLVGIPRPELLEYLREAAKGLDYLHTLNIQHRDVKPQNLLLVGGSVKVADFGLAKLLEHSLASNSGAMTPAYAAPEQIQGQLSPHADQYSLAVTYCQLRGGRLPFAGGTHQILFGHIQGQPDLSMLPEAERPAVARALAKQPDERWPSCRAFADALAGEVPAPRPPGGTPTLRTSVLYPRRRVRRYAVAGALALLAAAVAVGLFPGPIPPTTAGRLTVGEPVRAPAGDTGARAGTVPKPADGVPPGPPRPEVRERPPPLDCTGPEGLSAAEVRRAQEAWARYLGRQVEETVELPGGVTMTFVLVPPGKFRMGSPEGETNRGKDETLHTVVLTDPFDPGKYEVTQRQYEALTGKNPSNFKGQDLPVERVSWEEARDYGIELTRKRSDQHVYRLPSEAEWEYACRGGRPSSLPFGIGDGRSLSSREANFNGEYPYGGADKGPYLAKTSPVGSYPANAPGLCDMHGNVWEWCAHRYVPYPNEEVTNPTGPTEGPSRVFRGGDWNSIGGTVRAAIRNGYVPGYRSEGLGFRLARSLPSGGK
jgi:formylglycine-generating enzyme required for sulfatase activity